MASRREPPDDRAVRDAGERDAWPARSRVATWLGVFGIWTLLAFLSIAQTLLYLSDVGRPVYLRPLVVGRLADWYTCALFTPVLVWLVRGFPVERVTWRRSLPVLALSTLVIVAVKYAVYVPLRARLLPEGDPLTYRRALAANFLSETVIFAVVIAVLHSVEFSRRARERERQAGALRAELAEARLDALASQLQPHFLFNTLHGISTLMRRDVDAADEMLANLSDLLRRTLQRGGGSAHEVTLREERELLDRYLAIMRVRFGPRLEVTVDVDRAAEDALVPRLILQPLVENALQHGVARHAGVGHVAIRAAAERDTLEITVTNGGPADGNTSTVREGTGLSNTRRRLRELHGDDGRLEAGPLATGGFLVRLSMPLRA